MSVNRARFGLLRNTCLKRRVSSPHFFLSRNSENYKRQAPEFIHGFWRREVSKHLYQEKFKYYSWSGRTGVL
jgi:hypothetical protein